MCYKKQRSQELRHLITRMKENARKEVISDVNRNFLEQGFVSAEMDRPIGMAVL